MHIQRVSFTIRMFVIPGMICLVAACATHPPAPERVYEPVQIAPSVPEIAPPAAPPSPKKVMPPPKPVFYKHVVRWRGETLSHIALWYTGKDDNWERIARANPSLDRNRIRLGETILIPLDLLKNRKSMPSKFVQPPKVPVAKPSRDVTPSPVPGKPETVGLFEPVSSAEKKVDTSYNAKTDEIELFEPVD